MPAYRSFDIFLSNQKRRARQLFSTGGDRFYFSMSAKSPMHPSSGSITSHKPTCPDFRHDGCYDRQLPARLCHGNCRVGFDVFLAAATLVGHRARFEIDVVARDSGSPRGF